MLSTKPALQISKELPLRLADARRETDALFELVQPDALYDRPIPERHRIVFYIGHLEAFDSNLLNRRVLSFQSIRPDLDRLFAFGIDPVGGGLPNDQPGDWPKLEDVRSYVAHVREQIDDGLIRAQDEADRHDHDVDAVQLLNVAIEHRLMHAETLAYMLHRLPRERKVAPAGAKRNLLAEFRNTSSSHELIDIPAGTVSLGLSCADEAFGWDNEYERHSVHVPAFAIGRYKVTNGEYLEFVNAGGYADRALWRDEDWEWKEANRISHPAFWRREGRDWYWIGMFEEYPLPLDWPVYVSHAEASAYARWAGKSLPTEAQWQRAAYGSFESRSRSYPWGAEIPDATRGNFDFQNWDPVSVTSHPQGASAFGVEDMVGNGWEWTSTLFAPFAGFEPFSFYRVYSADFFDGKHYVLKGGSARTAACMLRPSFRNWFQPHYQYVYAGFRCVSNRD